MKTRIIRNVKVWSFLAAAISLCAIVAAVLFASPVSVFAQEQADPTASEVLKAATNYLNNLKQFSFSCEMVEDTLFEGGKQVKSTNDMVYYVKRPNKLRFRTEGDLRNRQWFYDGKTMTGYDFSTNLYSQESFPPTIDAALAKARDELNLRLAITAMGKTDFFEMLTENITSSVIVGISRVHGIPCYQLLLESGPVDIQLWIQIGERPLFRKAVITYKKEESQPEWSAVFTKRNTAPNLHDSFFDFKPPKGALKIEFLRQAVPKL